MSRDYPGEIAELIRQSRHLTVLTGAGISTESGIPDFRSPGGVWSKQSPVMFQDFLDDPSERRRYWRMRRESYPAMRDAAPNPGHKALAELAHRGILRDLITQNIDGLHQRAGTPEEQIVEIHGTACAVGCLTCDRTVAADEVQALLERGVEDPRCDECGGILKSRTISFGQSLPPEALRRSFQAAQSCDLFLVVGSSLQVEPAASLPLVAKRSGADLAIVNLTQTPLDRQADLVVHDGCGPVLSEVMARLRVD